MFSILISFGISLSSAFVLSPYVKNTLPLTHQEAQSSSSFMDEEDYSGRRNVLLGLAATTTASLIGKTRKQSVLNSNIATMNDSVTVLSVDKAIEILDKFCDRRFIHAVVASDYRFLYRGVSENGMRVQTKEPCDLLHYDTYRNSQALEFFQQLEETMASDVLQPSTSHLAITSRQRAQQWGTTAASIWPLQMGSTDDIAHYAWFAKGGLFWPRTKSSPGIMGRSDIIVDGRDCEKQGLEDALREDDCEVLFRTDQFLVIPIEYEAEFREKLRTSFIM